MPDVGPAPTGKCTSDACNFSKHVNIANNGGLYCCRMCKLTPGQHGPACAKTAHVEPAAPTKPVTAST